MPILRYWTNDITNIYCDHSESRTHVKMGPIRGRFDDILLISGVNFFHSQVKDILSNLQTVTAAATSSTTACKPCKAPSPGKSGTTSA